MDVTHVFCAGACPGCEVSLIRGILQRVAPCFQDLVEELAAPHWYVDRKGETPPGKKEYYQLPIYNYHKVCTSDSCLLHKLHSTGLAHHRRVQAVCLLNRPCLLRAA